MEEVKSDTEVQAQYIARNPVSRVIQCAAVQSENEVRLQTPGAELIFFILITRGMRSGALVTMSPCEEPRDDDVGRYFVFHVSV